MIGLRSLVWPALIFSGAVAVVGQERAAVEYIDGAEVARAFEQGRPLLEVNNYKVHASRRVEPGEAEVHDVDTDIIYVLDGEATFVTGGALVGGRTIAANETRGPEIRGGTTRRLSKGDFIVVPNGTPHWFQGVRGTFLYYVVKVPEGRKAG